ncbi:hypothetical protein C8J56DRAFT_979547 [Mycena floridula]|nr:hypothetical protein C8J56DRAFT_979547 [Mycena floridula]
MFTFIIISVALFATQVVADLSINTPTTIAQCTPVQFTWQKGTGPYNLVAVPAAEPCGDILVDMGDHTGLSMTWTPTLPVGTKIMLSVMDSTGEEGWTNEITIAAGSQDCLSPSAKSASATATSAGSAATTGTPAGTSAGSTATSDSSTSDDDEPKTPLGAAQEHPLTSAGNRISVPVMAISAIFAVVAML